MESVFVSCGIHLEQEKAKIKYPSAHEKPWTSFSTHRQKLMEAVTDPTPVTGAAVVQVAVPGGQAAQVVALVGLSADNITIGRRAR